jgi:pilus assembly protein Flp/PilA
MNDLVNKFFARLAADERGLTAVEYAVLGAIVVGVIAVAGVSFGSELTDKFAEIIPDAV